MLSLAAIALDRVDPSSDVPIARLDQLCRAYRGLVQVGEARRGNEAYETSRCAMQQD